MPTYTSTVGKWALRRLVGSNVISDIDAGFTALADDVDAKLSPVESGAFASRPVSTAGTPGKLGRHYLATDQGMLYLDTGTGWIPVTEQIGRVSYVASVGDPAGGTHLEADGRSVLRSDYPLCVVLIIATAGATSAFGPGNGSTTMTLPNLTGKVTVGRDPAAAVLPNTARAVGQVNGEERHSLTTSELAAHSHPLTLRMSGPPGAEGPDGRVVQLGTNAAAANYSEGGQGIGLGSPGLGATGSGTPHNVMQPGLVLTPVVRVR